jgi:hypothetical protein
MSKLDQKILDKFPFTSKQYIKEYAEITEDFAIKFYNWSLSDDGIDYAMKIETTEELIQIFKDNFYE